MCSKCGDDIITLQTEYERADDSAQYHTARHKCSLSSARLEEIAVIMRRYRKYQPGATIDDQQKVYDYLLKNTPH